jgi:hypothetical protein
MPTKKRRKRDRIRPETWDHFNAKLDAALERRNVYVPTFGDGVRNGITAGRARRRAKEAVEKGGVPRATWTLPNRLNALAP